jgi:ankyrin repeat protein
MASDLDQKLAQACRSGDARAARAVIKRGADTESRHDVYDDHGAFYTGMTPLMLACWSRQSNPETVAALLGFGADPHTTSDGGVTALWYSAGGGDDWHQGDSYDDESYAKRLELLLQAGGDPNEVADNGRSAMNEAASQGSASRVRLLLDAGARPNAIRVPDRHKAGLAGKIARELLFANVFDDTDGPPSFTVPLFSAAESGSVETVKLLLEAGAKADTKASDGKTAVCFARTPEVLRVLLDAGTPLHSVRGWRDELDEAFDNERYDLAGALIKESGGLRKWGDPGERINRYVGVNMDPKAVELLIRHGAPLDHRGEHGMTLLHTAAWQGDGNGGRENEVVAGVMRVLLDAGLDPRAKDDRGWEPIHEASSGDWGSPTSIRLLIEAGADPDARTRDGETPLMLTAGHGDLESSRALLEGGADPTLMNKGKTALKIAQDYADMSAGWAGSGGGLLMKGFMKGTSWLVGKAFGMPKELSGAMDIDMGAHYAETHKEALELVKLLERAESDRSP